jgi:hypothetical protein
MMTFIVIFALVLYFLPAIVASCREHHNKSAILALNLFLGWTFVGWVIALVWSLTNSAQAVATAAPPPAATIAPPASLVRQWRLALVRLAIAAVVVAAVAVAAMMRDDRAASKAPGAIPQPAPLTTAAGPQTSAPASRSCADQLTGEDLQVVNRNKMDPCLYLGLKREYRRVNGH